MPRYLVETYLSRGHAGDRRDLERRARSACEELTREGMCVRFEHTIYVPDDEICFFTFVARSSRDAAQVAHRAGLEAIRVVEAIS
jgi:hypothetical protein